MKNSLLRISLLLFVCLSLISCNRPEPNYEGVLMTNYGRDGIESFKTVTGAQGILFPGSELYQVPMFVDNGDCDPIKVSAKDAGIFTIDPSYTYVATRTQGPNIILNYKHLGTGDDFFNNIEEKVLNKLVTDAYREISRDYTTDSLMNNLGSFERQVEDSLKVRFTEKFFTLKTLTSGLTPPKSMADAIEARNNAIQKANEVRNQLETSRMLFEKAKIDAETNKMNSTGLTKEVLAEKWIDAIKNSTNKVIITDGKTPMILGQ